VHLTVLVFFLIYEAVSACGEAGNTSDRTSTLNYISLRFDSVFTAIAVISSEPFAGTKNVFTITAEIHARSLVNFYGQYADMRHMNLKFVRRVSEREREIRQFVLVKNKLISVFNAPVLLLTMNFVITLSK